MEFRLKVMEFQNRKDTPAFGNEDEMPAFGNNDEMPAFHGSNLEKDGSPNDDDADSSAKNMVLLGKKSERGNLLVC
jgi:hypothetical protein